MSLSCRKDGRNLTIKCDRCGRTTRHLRKVRGSWVNPNTGRKISDGVAWLCQAYYERIQHGR